MTMTLVEEDRAMGAGRASPPLGIPEAPEATRRVIALLTGEKLGLWHYLGPVDPEAYPVDMRYEVLTARGVRLYLPADAVLAWALGVATESGLGAELAYEDDVLPGSAGARRRLVESREPGVPMAKSLARRIGYDEAAAELVSDRRVMTPTDVALLIGVKPQTFHKWAFQANVALKEGRDPDLDPSALPAPVEPDAPSRNRLYSVGAVWRWAIQTGRVKRDGTLASVKSPGARRTRR